MRLATLLLVVLVWLGALERLSTQFFENERLVPFSSWVMEIG